MSAGYELRIYRCPGPTHLAKLNAMLGEEGITMFRRHGIEVADAWTVAVGAATSVLVYLCPFESLAERDKAWASVDGDAAWQDTKKSYSEGIGPLTSELEFWWLESLTSLELPAGANAAADLLTLPDEAGFTPGQFDIVYGPTGRRLAITEAGQAPRAVGQGGRRVRLKRVPWSPAVQDGVRLGAVAHR